MLGWSLLVRINMVLKKVLLKTMVCVFKSVLHTLAVDTALGNPEKKNRQNDLSLR